jgi:hypothetical protein
MIGIDLPMTWKVKTGFYAKSPGHVAICSLKHPARFKVSQFFGSDKVSVHIFASVGKQMIGYTHHP